MNPLYPGLVAASLLAGSTGYALHHYVTRSAGNDALATVATASAPPSAAPLSWSFADVDGKQQALAQWQDRLVVINFWATWCPPCLKEIPAFVALQQRYADQGLQFVGIALDQADAVRPFITDHGINYPILVGDQDVARYMQILGNAIGGLPYTIVIGRNGEVLTSHQGEWPAEAAQKVLEGYLNAAQ